MLFVTRLAWQLLPVHYVSAVKKRLLFQVPDGNFDNVRTLKCYKERR